MSQNISFKDKIFSNPAGYSIFYVCLAVPTYIIPWIKPGPLSKAAEASGYGKGASSASTVYTIIQIALFAGLVYGAHVRGQKTNKPYLKYFALAAGAFDLLPYLTYIPFVPSVMHALGIGMGLTDQPKVVEQHKVESQPETQNKAA
ncbi:MAG: hypothetical protein H7328_05270 [Bdellovibrio sp.]|nr:hypothetical protein [Bdellovibrio sp.]